MFKFLFLFLFLFLISCTNISYTNIGNNNSYFNSKKNYNKYIIIKKKKEFYFWGNLPEKHIVDLSVILDEEFITNNIANLKIKEYQTPFQVFQEIITLGLFIPKTIEVSGYVKVK